VPVLGVLGSHLVALGLTRLRQQDQRRGVCGLGGEREIEQDERIGVPVLDDRDRVEHDPEHDHDRLADDVLRRPEEARRVLRRPTERVGPERPVVLHVIRASCHPCPG